MRIVIFGVAALALVACNNRQNFECQQASSCDLSGGGMCLGAPSGNMWCAYPDPLCPSGYRYSSQDVGDGLGGMCVPDSIQHDGGIDGSSGKMDAAHVVPGSWSKQIPGAGFESVDSIAVASDGSVFILGSFDGSLDLGQPMTATGTTDLFVTKFTSAGDHVWSHRYGGTGASGAGGSNTGVAKIKILSNGDLVIAGGFYGSLTLGANTFTALGNDDVYVARLSSIGDVIWSVTGGSTGYDAIGGLAVDASDNIAICGGKSLDGTFFGTAFSGGANPWIARLTGAGSPSWVKALAGSVGNQTVVSR